MKQYQKIFTRYEKKYFVNDKKYKLLRQKLSEYFIADNYGKTTICNIYFDTPDYRIIRTSLEAPVYKEKLRLRSYGLPSEGDSVFIELKKKYKGIVYKRRVRAELSEAEDYLYNQKPLVKQTQITREIDWFINLYQELKPSMYISYDRIAMYGIDNEDLRITFDSNILWREEDLRLEDGIWGKPLLEDGYKLMEIKIPGAMPVCLAYILNELEIYPVSFSKYGRGYQELEKSKRNERERSNLIYA